MDLNVLWFVLIAILYVGFFFLEGFDFGVSMLLPFAGRNDGERRVILNTVGPHWDGNEVWLITAGGATFAAFPHWYATLFSGFYAALFLLLLALIVRGVAFEFRSKVANLGWRSFWDWAIFLGGLLPAFLFGVAFANIVQGVPINDQMIYTGGFLNLLNPYGLLGGLCMVILMAYYGSLFLNLKTAGDICQRAKKIAGLLWLPAWIVELLFLAATIFFTDILQKPVVVVLPVMAVLSLAFAGLCLYRKRGGWAFVLAAVSMIILVASFFAVLFPRLMVSSIDPVQNSLTIYNASSTPYTLKIMSVVAAIFLPFILAYQAWTYWVFRKRIDVKAKELMY